MLNSKSKIILTLLGLLIATGCAKKSEQTTPAKVEPKAITSKKPEAPDANPDPSKLDSKSSDPIDLAKALQANGQTGNDQPILDRDTPVAAAGDNKNAPLTLPTPVPTPAPKSTDSRPLPIDTTIVPGGNPASLAQETCPVDSTPLTPNQEKYCTPLFPIEQKYSEKCISQKIVDLSAKLTAENRELVGDALQWIMN